MCILDNIIHLLKENGYKQSDLTNYLSLSHNVFTEWKAGRNTSYKKHLPEIAEFFGVPTDYLLGKGSSDSSTFTYAMYNELTHDLSEEKIEQLKKYADFLRQN